MYLDIDRLSGYNTGILGEGAFNARAPRKGEMTMPEKTEAQKRAQKNYMDKFAIARVRMEKSRYEDIQAHAAAQGESVNGFINRAIDHEMERDAAKGQDRQ